MDNAADNENMGYVSDDDDRMSEVSANSLPVVVNMMREARIENAAEGEQQKRRVKPRRVLPIWTRRIDRGISRPR